MSIIKMINILKEGSLEDRIKRLEEGSTPIKSLPERVKPVINETLKKEEEKAMLKPVIRLSPWGFAVAGLFLLAVGTLFAWIFFIASKNPADSGESAIILLPFAMPWIMMIPSSWLGPFVGLSCFLLNALILYFVFGGLRLKKTD